MNWLFPILYQWCLIVSPRAKAEEKQQVACPAVSINPLANAFQTGLSAVNAIFW